jgi:hypothetical protein
VDDADATKAGGWTDSLVSGWGALGKGYLHDGNSGKGKSSITFAPVIPTSGEFEIVLLFPPHPNRATNVPVDVTIDGHTTTITVDQRKPETKGMVSVGKFRLPKGELTKVTISNRSTTGYVVADAVQFLPAK